MFGKLRDKLKGWVSKNEEEPAEEAVEETVEEEKPKKSTKKSTAKKTTTKKGKEKPKTKKAKKAKEPEIEKPEEVEEVEEKPKEKKSFFARFKKEKAEGETEKTVPEEAKEAEEQLEEAEEAEEEKEEIKEEPKKKKLSFFSKELTEEKFDELFSELQLILLQNNVAYEAVEAIEEHLKESLVGKSLKQVNLATELKTAIEKLLINPPNFIEQIKSADKPFIILFSGINGSGKTTTIAKVANLLKKNGLSVCLAAADTFRAAAIQQLEEHAKNLDVPVIKKDYGADPASVGFDAIKYAEKHKTDIVLIDTAGRIQNRDTLMKELEKISRVTKPDMKIFLGESTTGNDATLQAKAFNEAIGLTGIILSKADVDESGGTAISVAHVTNAPILFLGTGQGYDDLEVFDKEKLIEKLGL